MERIPDELLGRFVRGVNLMPGTLRDQLGPHPTLLVFLRYFGCPFCKLTITDLREIAQRVAGYPPVLFLYQGTQNEGRAFLRRYWPDARAVADPEGSLYDGMKVGHGGFAQMFHPGVVPSLIRAAAKGHLASEPEPSAESSAVDTRRLPGLFVARGAEILWSHRARHQADHPAFARIPQLAGLAPNP